MKLYEESTAEKFDGTICTIGGSDTVDKGLKFISCHILKTHLSSAEREFELEDVSFFCEFVCLFTTYLHIMFSYCVAESECLEFYFLCSCLLFLLVFLFFEDVFLPVDDLCDDDALTGCDFDEIQIH